MTNNRSAPVNLRNLLDEIIQIACIDVATIPVQEIDATIEKILTVLNFIHSPSNRHSLNQLKSMGEPFEEAPFYQNLGALYIRKGNLPLAVEAYRKMVGHDSSVTNVIQLANALVTSDNEKDRQESLRFLLKLLNTKKLSKLELAAINYSLGRNSLSGVYHLGETEGLAYLNAAVKLGHQRAKTLTLIYTGTQAKSQNNVGVALRLYNEAFLCADDDNKSEILFRMGLIFLDKKTADYDLKQGMFYYEKAVSLNTVYETQLVPLDTTPATINNIKKKHSIQEEFATTNYAAICAHMLTGIYRGLIDESILDMEKALHYLHIGADQFHYTPACYDLGKIYLLGSYEQPVDHKKAEPYLIEAAQNGCNDAKKALAILYWDLLKDASKAVIWFEATEPNKSPEFNFAQGLCYFTYACNRYRMSEFDKIKDAAVKERTLEKINAWCAKALKAFCKALDHGDERAHLYLSILYYSGLGVKVNHDAAEKHLLAAPHLNNTLALQLLAAIYIRKLVSAERPEDIRHYAGKALYYARKSKQLPEEIKKSLFLGITDKVIQQLKQERFKEYDQVTLMVKFVKEMSDDVTVPIKKRITDLLEMLHECQGPTSLATLINRLGKLVEQIPDSRDFLHRIAPEFIKIINAVAVNMPIMNAKQLVLVMTGLSKLNLSANVVQLNNLYNQLFQQVQQHLSEMEIKDIITLIHASTRIDRKHELFDRRLPKILTTLATGLGDADYQDLASLLYALAVLDSAGFNYITQFNLENMIKSLIAHHAASSMEDNIALHQTYMAIFYFSHKYPTAMDNSALLHQWEEKLSAYAPATQTSTLQAQVVSLLEEYTVQIKEEELINTLPVDALCRLSAHEAFILQVDGPSHYLFDLDGKTTLNSKTIFRNAFLSSSTPLPLLAIPYYQWQQAATQTSEFEFLTESLANLRLTIDTKKWHLVESQNRESQFQSATLFSAARRTVQEEDGNTSSPRPSPPPRAWRRGSLLS